MREATNGQYPRYAIFENVKGAFSSNNGADFKAVLEAFCRIKDEDACIPEPPKGKWSNAGCIMGDGYSLAWRLFDSQYWGVPQRRERIYLVADFTGWSAGEILFKRDGVPWHTPEGFRTREEAAACLGDGSEASGRYVLNDQGGSEMSVTEDVTATLRAQEHGHQPVVAVCESVSPRAFGICSKTSHGMLGDNPDVGFYEAETSRCLDQGSGSPTRNQGGMVVVEGNGQRPSHKGDGYKESETMYTLNATEMHAVAFADKAASLSANDGPKGLSSQQLKNPEQNFVGEPYHSSKNSYHTEFKNDPVVDTLVASDFKDPPTVTVYYSNHASGMNADFSGEETLRTLAASDYKDPPTVCEEPYYIVRRLTPIECARLQGFPDKWCDGLSDDNPSDEEIDKWMDIFEDYRNAITHAKNPRTRNQVIKWLKDPYSDSEAYKMWGNGISLPIPFFILSQIVYYAQNDPATIGT